MAYACIALQPCVFIWGGVVVAEHKKEKAAKLSRVAEGPAQRNVSTPAAVWPDNSTPVS